MQASLVAPGIIYMYMKIKNIQNVKRCRDGMPKKYENKEGMMHESKGQCIGKAPSLSFSHYR